MYSDPVRSSGFAQFHILRICANYFKLSYQLSKSNVVVSERSLLSPTAFIDAQEIHGYFSEFSTQYLKKELEVLQCECAGYLPNYVIFLKTTPELSYARMISRGHKEEELVALDYLQSVDKALLSQFTNRRNTFVIDIDEKTSKESVFKQTLEILTRHG